MSILNTGRLFAKLLRPFSIDVVCDIGSLNGADALRFRRAAPGARIVAFEPNPSNYRAMRESRALAAAGIETLPYAISAHEGDAEFFIVPVAGPADLARRGMSSLHLRAEPVHRGRKIVVQTRRLDGLLAEPARTGARIALWIDAEGAAFEVLQGGLGILDAVQLLHVEVETRACIGASQKLYPDVAGLLADRGFVEIATDEPRDAMQFNSLYVRAALPAALANLVERRVRHEARRRRLVRATLAACPPRLRGYLLRMTQIPTAVG